MNLYGIVVLAALLLDYVLSLVADFLNLAALDRDPPPHLADVYDPDSYRRSQQYTRVTTRFQAGQATFDLLVLLGFWFAGGFEALDRWLLGFGLGSIATGLLFISILALAKGALALPFGAYATFVIEERFGFNRTTVRTFVLDLLKAVGLAAVLGAPILAAVLALFERAGGWAWVACWGVGSIFVLLVQLFLPTWILPLFNRFEPLAEGELRAALAGYARSVGFGVSGIYVIDGSRRSTRSNAFFTGFGRTKRIALFDTLVDKHSVPELVAVLAHEVGHYERGHVVKGLVLGIAHLGALFFLLSVFLQHRGLFEAFFMSHAPVYAGLVFFGLLFAPAELILSLGLHYLSRRFEHEADRFAARTTGDPETIVSALKKLSSDNLSNLTPHPLYVALHYSHPTLERRVEAVRRAAAQSSPSGSPD